jgi:hypothetical protein
MLNGVPQFYLRDQEARDKQGQWFAQPVFITERDRSAVFGEPAARALVDKIRSQFSWRGEIWIEAGDGRRIDIPIPGEAQPEERVPVIATLDEDEANGSWYVIKPTTRPDGPCWFMKIQLPGRPAEVIYEKEPLAVLERARDLGWLRFAEKYERPQPSPQPQQQPGPRMRPGEFSK